ncbi:MAG: hypothetical protein ACRCWI_04645 [Brevinema sp.]
MKKELPHSKPLNGKEWITSSVYTLPNGDVVHHKPENMTQLLGNKLVYKDDPRIILRGKLDSFQSGLAVIIHQVRSQYQVSSSLIEQLRALLSYSRDILKHEVLNTPLPIQTLLSWTYDEIREYSHNPAKYFGLPQMLLVDDSFSPVVLTLNLLRASIREIEIHAVQAFHEENKRDDLVMALNRMSSCFHILMYQEIADEEQRNNTSPS